MTKEQEWQKVIYQIEIVSNQLPEKWRQQVYSLAAQLNQELTKVVIRSSHPPTEVFTSCPQCRNVSSLGVSAAGCKCVSCGYVNDSPVLNTDLDKSCPNCGEPTQIVAESSATCIGCNHQGAWLPNG